MSNKNRFDGNLHDHVIYCDICGCPTSYTEATLLDVYTGRGGLLVCKKDRDIIDYGLVPYKISTESPIQKTALNHYVTDPLDVPNTYGAFDYALYDPMNYDPNNPPSPSVDTVWEALDLQIWDNWTTAWGT